MTEPVRSFPARKSSRWKTYLAHDHSDESELGTVSADMVDSKHYYTVASQAEMLALTPPVGTLCYRTDNQSLYIYIGP